MTNAQSRGNALLAILSGNDPVQIADLDVAHCVQFASLDPETQQEWLHHVINAGALAGLDWMIARNVPLSVCDTCGYTPILAALELDEPLRYAVMERLIAGGADVDAHGFNDWTPLHKAAAANDLKALRLLLDAGADRSRKTRIDDLATPEEEARMLGQQAAAAFLADYTGSADA
ncbi:ankyrin repeat domain-containing protein [Roseobacter sp. YSTF-M11]|uniref:Ankyrin repeat domain-containing protein n=1 Tax=Roseobacter insulae TaxID=2859783 RepID=A0A9X1JZU4_9RHOB|nr:ankyrin repeat domain-containing protein [Roseobacter insulae]MBW4707534.1 ankyrin repeat domain-containing protein [Roseobacter insulae]